MAWRLNSFFGCATLETGGRVVGGFELGFALVTLIMSIIGIIGGLVIINDPKTTPEDLSLMKSWYTLFYIC